MPRGDKSSYTGKQRGQAAHIEEVHEEKGISKDEAERRAWATVNKADRGGQEERLDVRQEVGQKRQQGGWTGYPARRENKVTKPFRVIM
jgi:hypothetical protein